MPAPRIPCPGLETRPVTAGLFVRPGRTSPPVAAWHGPIHITRSDAGVLAVSGLNAIIGRVAVATGAFSEGGRGVSPE
jgi:hypothetical protein